MNSPVIIAMVTIYKITFDFCTITIFAVHFISCFIPTGIILVHKFTAHCTCIITIAITIFTKMLIITIRNYLTTAVPFTALHTLIIISIGTIVTYILFRIFYVYYVTIFHNFSTSFTCKVTVSFITIFTYYSIVMSCICSVFLDKFTAIITDYIIVRVTVITYEVCMITSFNYFTLIKCMQFSTNTTFHLL